MTLPLNPCYQRRRICFGCDAQEKNKVKPYLELSKFGHHHHLICAGARLYFQ